MRLWDIGPRECELDLLTIFRLITSLVCARCSVILARWLSGFFLDKSLIIEEIMTLVSPVTGSKILIIYFSWCSFNHFQNWHNCLSCPTHVGGERLRKIVKMLSAFLSAFAQFSAKLWHTVFRLRPRRHNLVSVVERRAGTFKFEFH